MTDESREPIFHTKHGLGYKFTGTKTDYKTVIRKILQENPFFNLFETLLLENEVNLVKFAYENYLSESTVRKRSYELETLLQPLGFTVKKNKGTLYLVGDEPRIRYFMVAFFGKIFLVFTGHFQVFLNKNVKCSPDTFMKSMKFLSMRLN